MYVCVIQYSVHGTDSILISYTYQTRAVDYVTLFFVAGRSVVHSLIRTNNICDKKHT